MIGISPTDLCICTFNFKVKNTEWLCFAYPQKAVKSVKEIRREQIPSVPPDLIKFRSDGKHFHKIAMRGKGHVLDEVGDE
ncbi:unnamed protein product [Onchocerca flexuosa]|uniref:Transposase n=1 Tax=Onchocerca flexuosa TaxID=387005 RepID=A0A183H8N5_9BILA|nr:unnamed protein product [Onchocerca flexuosa]